MNYTRLYATDDGESHFGHVEFELTMTSYVSSAPPLELSPMSRALQFGFMRAPAGWSSEWHPWATRNLFFVLSGEWEVTASDGEARQFGVGSVLLVEDTTGKGHKSRVNGQIGSLAAMVELGE